MMDSPLSDDRSMVARLMPRRSEWPLLFGAPRIFVRKYRWALVMLVLAASADVFTTLWNARVYGADIEVHAVQRILWQFLGIEAGVPVGKLIQLGFVVLVASWWRPWCRVLLILCAVLYAVAAASNYFLWI